MPKKKRAAAAFLTGSQVYGIPREDSDVDLVVLMEPEQAAELADAMGVEVEREQVGRYPSLQFTVGKLNLIVEADPALFDVWAKGTRLLLDRAPVTREEAVAEFAKLREAVK